MARTTDKSSSLLGKAKELQVAGALIEEGLYVFFPLVDTGFDLVVTSDKGTMFIPVQVKFRARDPGLGLKPQDIARFEDTGVVVAWVISSIENSWYIPFVDWHKRAKAPDRADGLKYISIRESESWLSAYKGSAGIFRAFAPLFRHESHRHSTKRA